MCGIAGIVLREDVVDEADLQRMAAALTHRGPEDSGVHVAGRIGLAHTRLAIIDVAGGHQPLFDASGRHALVCNGEIYNYVELRRELEALGARPSTHSDSEVALHGYAHWGSDAFRRLRGMYAFALHDRETDALWLVRDRLGIKPLYLARLPDRILFASELKALLPLLPARRVHAGALAQYFQNQHASGAPTAVDGIERVPAGCALRIGRDLSVDTLRYWSPLEVRARHRLAFDDAVAEWETLFAQVMREHMRSDVPFGLFLSGGVDSAVLLGQLTRHRSEPVRTYSIGWTDARQRDELDEAQVIAARFGAEHRAIRMDAQAVFRRLPRMIWAADDLMRDYASLPTLALAEAAGRELKVVFSGEGGDEAFAGYGRYRPDWFERQYKALRHPGSGGFRVRPELDAAWTRLLFAPELQVALRQHRDPVVRAWRETPPGWSDLQRRQYADLQTNLQDDLLVKADRMLMSFGVEGRVPFVDHRVVEFGLSLPDGLKVSRRGGKLFLRRWAESFVPPDHLWRHKRGFHVPVGEWLRGSFLDRLATLLPRSVAVRAWCRTDTVRALLARQQHRGDVSREVFSLLQFAIWHRLFIENGHRAPSAEEDPLEWIA